MVYIKPNPKSWTIYMVDGEIRTGVGAGRRPGDYYYVSGGRIKREITEVDNFFFTANIEVIGVEKGQSSVTTIFGDSGNSVQRYWASSLATAMILLGVELGAIDVVDGSYSGVWTYRKMGTTVSIWPCYIDISSGQTEFSKTMLDDARDEWRRGFVEVAK